MTGQVIWCIGLYASASTWIYNVVRQAAEITHPGKVRTHFLSSNVIPLTYKQTDIVNIVKSHEIGSEAVVVELASRSDKIIVSTRDPRDAVTSLMLYHGHTFERALTLVEMAIRLCQRFIRDPRTVLFRYETGFFDEKKTINSVAAHLGFHLEKHDEQSIFTAMQRQSIESFIAGLHELPGALQDRVSGDRLDPVTHWHTHHSGRTGEIGKWKRSLTEQQALQVADQLKDLEGFWRV